MAELSTGALELVMTHLQRDQLGPSLDMLMLSPAHNMPAGPSKVVEATEDEEHVIDLPQQGLEVRERRDAAEETQAPVETKPGVGFLGGGGLGLAWLDPGY